MASEDAAFAERTEVEYRALLANSGLQRNSVTCWRMAGWN